MSPKPVVMRAAEIPKKDKATWVRECKRLASDYPTLHVAVLAGPADGTLHVSWAKKERPRGHPGPTYIASLQLDWEHGWWVLDLALWKGKRPGCSVECATMAKAFSTLRKHLREIGVTRRAARSRPAR